MTPVIDAMIVGAEKAGTTSLLRYLSEHPEVVSHEGMEMPFFVDEELYKKGWDWAHKEYFSSKMGGTIILAKSVGCMYWPHVPERLYAHNPNMKLIAALRNPVDRSYSAYWYAVQKGREDKKTFEEAIAAEPERLECGNDFHLRYHAYVYRGLYARQLLGLLEFFPAEQLQVVIFEHFKTAPERTIMELFRFLDLSSARVDVMKRHNETLSNRKPVLDYFRSNTALLPRIIKFILPKNSRRKALSLLEQLGRNREAIPPINADTEASLNVFYEQEIASLERLFGKDLAIWHQVIDQQRSTS
jgi:hypothetical protein